VKTLTVKHWEHACASCATEFDIEEAEARMAPDVPLFVAPGEKPYAVLDARGRVTCPHCNHTSMVKLGKGKNKKVELTLLVHPQWLAGSPKVDGSGKPFGGSAQDNAASSARWNQERAAKLRLLEVRGTLPDEVACPETKVVFKPEVGTVPKRSKFACASCGTVQDVMTSIKATKKSGQMAGYAVQGYAPKRGEAGKPYNGRFFAAYDEAHATQYDAAFAEWEARKDGDLKDYWPRSEVPYGFMTAVANSDIRENYGFTHWWTMFNPRQMLVHAQLLKAIVNVGNYDWNVREYVLGAFQQYLRNQCLFSFWNPQRDTPEPMFSNNNYHPKSTVVENCVFPKLGRGNWASSIEGIIEGRDWAIQPWEAVSIESLKRHDVTLAEQLSGKSEKVLPGDPVQKAAVTQGSSTDLGSFSDGSLDLVITDPPFGGLLHYSELADFFYVWLRLVLKDKYPDYFTAEYTPKSLEAVANKAREPEDPDGFYQRLLTQCWREAHRVLKPSGILAFTFHHSEDEPWVAVLESLFDAGYYLEATYPIRSDETKGEGEFGSKTIEYDIIHVCRKRTEEPKPVSWARMRREVLEDVRRLQQLLQNHAKEGLPEADIQVIKRGKALEYFSRHYGKVYVDEDRPISVKDALVGINQLIDETSGKGNEPPPVTAEPVTRQFLRIFDGASSQPRDQMQKFLRGSGMAPEEFEQRGWSKEEQKVFHVVSPLDLAQSWVGRHRRNMTSDYDQAMFLIGACYDGSGINAAETLKNENFRPHPALKALLEWHSRRGAKQEVRNAASRALSIYQNWENTHQDQVKQLSFFEDA
jgi:putative DNA methylase